MSEIDNQLPIVLVCHNCENTQHITATELRNPLAKCPKCNASIANTNDDSASTEPEYT